MFVSISVNTVITPFYMQGVLNTPIGIAGMYMSISPAIVFLITLICGYINDRIGGEKLSIIGQVCTCAGLFQMTILAKGSSVITLVLFICIVNFGSSLFQAPNYAFIMSNIPPEKFGIGGSVNMGVRHIGLSLSIALSTSILYGGISKVLGYRVTGYERERGMEDAFMSRMRNTYILLAVLCAISIAISILMVITKNKQKRFN